MTVAEAKLKKGDRVRYAGWSAAYEVVDVQEKGVKLMALAKPPVHFCENWQNIERLDSNADVGVIT